MGVGEPWFWSFRNDKGASFTVLRRYFLEFAANYIDATHTFLTVFLNKKASIVLVDKTDIEESYGFIHTKIKLLQSAKNLESELSDKTLVSTVLLSLQVRICLGC